MIEENVKEVIEKKVTINEDKNEEMEIEKIDIIDEAGKTIVNELPHKGLINNFLLLLKNLVEIAVSRGSYQAFEVESVGKVYNEFTSQIKIKEDSDITKEGSNVLVTTLVNMKALIELSIQRGKWKADELTNVGNLYNNLNSILAPKQEEQQLEQKEE
jgi:hypothetical protein